MKVYNTFNPGVLVGTFTEDDPIIEIHFQEYNLLLTESEAKTLIEWINQGLTKLSEIRYELAKSEDEK